jgi:WD40 repeat protein
MEKNVAMGKPVRVSASWVVDPPERAVDGNMNNWWGAGGEVPQWIEVDLQGIYSISRIRVINQGPEGTASYKVLGRGIDNVNHLLHDFDGPKYANQTLEFSPDQPWEGISTVRVEINNGSGWVGFREVMVFSREDPQPLAIVSEPAPLFQAQIQVNDLESITPENAIRMQPLAALGLGTINELAWAPDGSAFAAAGTLGVWLYDPTAMEKAPRLLESHTREVLTVAYSSDGDTLYSGSQDGTVKLWNPNTGKVNLTRHLFDDFSYEVGTQERNAEVWAMALNDDQTLLAAGAFDGTITLYNLSTGVKIGELKGHSGDVADLAFSSDGQYLASTAADGRLILWNLATSKKYADLTGYSGRIWQLVFSPDGLTLASAGSDGQVRLWDVATAQEKATLPGHTASVLQLAFTPNGSLLISSSLDMTVRVWNLNTGSSMVFLENIPTAKALAVDPAKPLLAVQDYYAGLELWDMEQGLLVGTSPNHTNSVTSINFNPQTQWLAAGYEDGSIRLWDVGSNATVRMLWGHNAGVTGVAFNPAGDRLASSSFDGTVLLWDANSGEVFSVLEGHQSYVRCVDFSPDGRLVASGSTDNTIRIWDAQTGDQIAVLQGHTAEVSRVRFSPDSSKLVSVGSDFTVRLWDVPSATLFNVFQHHTSYVQGVVFSPDGARLATASGDHSLRLIEVENGIQVFKPKGHGGWVLDVDFSPQGDTIASANVSTTSFWVAPGEIHLYSADSGYPLVMLRGHMKRVTCLTFLLDGKVLASGSADGSIRLWGVPESSP